MSVHGMSKTRSCVATSCSRRGAFWRLPFRFRTRNLSIRETSVGASLGSRRGLDSGYLAPQHAPQTSVKQWRMARLWQLVQEDARRRSLERSRVTVRPALAFGGDRFVDTERLTVYNLGIHSGSTESLRASPPKRNSATIHPGSLRFHAPQRFRAKSNCTECRSTRTVPDSGHQSSRSRYRS